jgi:hypothetical protein
VLRISLIVCVSTASVAFPRTQPSPAPSHIISHIPRQPVESTAIAKIGYSKRRHILEIEFVNGAVYRYLDVPVTAYRDLMSAESKTRFYDSNVKGHYRSVLVRSRQKEQVPQPSRFGPRAARLHCRANLGMNDQECARGRKTESGNWPATDGNQRPGFP